MEAIFLVCGAGGPQLKRNPLGVTTMPLLRRRLPSVPVKSGETIGPSPWYMRQRSLTRGAELLKWRDPGDKPPYAMCSVLDESRGATILAVGGNTYCRLLDPNRVLLWTPEPKPRPEKPQRLIFQAYDLAALAPLTDVQSACEQISNGLVSLLSGAPPLDQFGLSLSLGPGAHPLDFPDWLRPLPELLVLVDGPDGSWDRGDRRIWSLHPARGEVTVLPQDWFNNGAHDFGYEWITRVARDEAGRIVGDGIRIKPFRLDESGRNLETWLDKDPLGEPW